MNNTYLSQANNFKDNNEIFNGVLINDDGKNVDIIRDNDELKNSSDLLYRKINLGCIMQKHPDGTISYNLYTGTEEDLGLAIPFDENIDNFALNFLIKDLVLYNKYNLTSYLSLLENGKVDLKANNISVLKTIKDALQKQYDINAQQITTNTSIITFNTTLIAALGNVGGISGAEITALTNNNTTITTNNTTLQTRNSELLVIINILTSLIAP